MKMNVMKFVGILAIAFGFVACNPGEFGDLNVDPNNTTSPQASLVFTNAMRGISGVITQTQGTTYSQHLAQTQYTDSDRYATERFNYDGYYTGMIADLTFLIEYNTNPETAGIAAAAGPNAHQIAMANIMRAWMYNHITDRWGDVPYSEAMGALSTSGDLNFQPVFDTQQSVYDDLFTQLTAAVNSIDVSQPGVDGDILFQGDMAMWRKFGNSLRLLMALRISDVDAGKAQSEFSAALNAPGGVIGAGEDIYYTYLPEQNNDNPWEDRFETRQDWAVAATIMQYLNPSDERSDASDPAAFGMLDAGNSDPRRPIFADASVTGEQLYGNAFIGMPYGVNEAIAGSYTNDEVSLLGTPMRQQTSPGLIISHAEVEFAMAEAILKGFSGVPGTAGSHYDAGIQSSMDFYGVDIGNYMTNAIVAYAGDPSMDQVLTQRWIANYLYGYPAWATWRRTNIPALQPAVDAVNNSGEIPVRQGYSTTERDLNGTNYDEANTRQGITGTNMLDVRVWWDTQDNY